MKPNDIPEGYMGIEMAYQPSTNTLYIMAQASAIDPEYLKYLLEYLGIPGATVMFISTEEPKNGEK
jgi:hypothetical protein